MKKAKKKAVKIKARRRIRRSARSGRFVSKAAVKCNPAETVTETVK